MNQHDTGGMQTKLQHEYESKSLEINELKRKLTKAQHEKESTAQETNELKRKIHQLSMDCHKLIWEREKLKMENCVPESDPSLSTEDTSPDYEETSDVPAT